MVSRDLLCQDPACVPPLAGGGIGILIKYCALGDRALQVLVMTSEGVDFKKEICFIKAKMFFLSETCYNSDLFMILNLF